MAATRTVLGVISQRNLNLYGSVLINKFVTRKFHRCISCVSQVNSSFTKKLVSSNTKSKSSCGLFNITSYCILPRYRYNFAFVYNYYRIKVIISRLIFASLI